MSMPSPSPASSRRAPCRATTRIKYATSILDYVFRELAVSYMSRFDLAHVDPNESGFDALGKGVEEGKEPEDGRGQQATKYLSKGLTRSRTDNLVVMRGGSTAVSAGSDSAPSGGSKVTSLSPQGPHGRVSDTTRGRGRAEAGGATRPLAHGKARGAAMEQGGSSRSAAAPSKAERRAEAKAKGYEGEMCSECGNFTLVRNGTCMKCDTCGSTTGCS